MRDLASWTFFAFPNTSDQCDTFFAAMKEEILGGLIDRQTFLQQADRIKNVLGRLYNDPDLTIYFGVLNKIGPISRPLFYNNTRHALTGLDLVNFTCEYLCVPLNELISSSRESFLVYPRHLVIYFLSKYSDMSQQEIATFFNKKQRSSIVHAKKTVEFYLKNENLDPRYAEDINYLTNILQCKS